MGKYDCINCINDGICDLEDRKDHAYNLRDGTKDCFVAKESEDNNVIKNHWHEEVVQNIKYCGQSLIDNAENIISNYKYPRSFTITCYVTGIDEPPYISVDTEFIPEGLIEQYK